MPKSSLKSWPAQDAKARFSELLNACEQDGPQVVTRRGVEAAVIVPYAQWDAANGAERPDLKDLLLTDFARGDDVIPPRAKNVRRRAPLKF